MNSLTLQAVKRGVLGKKAKQLRQAGVIPVNVYGSRIESLALQVEVLPLGKILSQAGETHLISLAVEGEKQLRIVLVDEVQRNTVTEALIHVNFYQPGTQERIKVEVPINFVGESPAVKARKGDLLTNLRTVEVECLPANIPSSFDVDLSQLSQLESDLHVKDLKAGEGVTILTDPEQMIVKVEPIVVEKEVTKKAEVNVEEVANVAEEKPKEKRE